MKKLHMLALLLAVSGGAATLQSCSYASANMQTIVTEDCGQSWRRVKTGEHVPNTMGACEYRVSIPDYPMQGESSFRATFANRVRATMEVSYDYTISDGLKFVQEAKYLGTKDTESDKAGMDRRFETAENMVIDKRIKEVAREMLLNEDIVEFDQSAFETKLFERVNAMLLERGVKLSFISLVPQPSEQTARAIDVATAWKIYESKGLQEVGKTVIGNSAGSTRIVTNVSPSAVSKEDEDNSDQK